ncbi:MAG: repair exonuclease [Verrucomicrobiaceae bacterium]|nr:repair exonuclease [Verrucomicrobiaceae bacterium]
MFRFIHAADPHLDSPLLGLESYEGAPVETIRGATRRAFENLVALALEQAVDFILIAGDLYDGDWKDYSTGLFFTGQMARLRAAAIPVFFIAGNHDAESVMTRKLKLPDNVRLFSSLTAEAVGVPGLPVTLHGRSFPNRAVPENLVPKYPGPVKGRFNIGLLHTSLSGLPGHDTYAPCALKDLQEKGYDYWALGHVHQPMEFSAEPWIGFAGNLQGRHVRETGVHGCRLVTVNDSLRIESNVFMPLDVVRWEVLEVDLAGLENDAAAMDRLGQRLRAATTAAEDRLLAVRLVFTGATALHGALHRDARHLRAECLAVAQQCGGPVWIEEVKLRTSPVYDLTELAERDSLTGIVVETLHSAGAGLHEMPADIQAMLEVLPTALRAEVAAELEGEARHALLDDVRAIILEALTTKGGEAA